MGNGILATGSYLPEREVSNAEVAECSAVTADWIEERTRIKTRRWAFPSEATSDLATAAGERALTQAGLPADRMRYLIVSTSTGDFSQPPTSYLVQAAPGARSAACFDINVVCSGFVYGLALAASLTTADPGSYAPVIGADVCSRILDFSDHRSAVLLGDGAGAAVVGPMGGPAAFLGFALASRGDAHHLIRVEAGGSRCPTTHETVDAGGHFFKMNGRGVRDFVLEEVPPLLARLADGAWVGIDGVQHFVPHQPNGVLLQKLVEKAGLVGARTHQTVERYGNNGSASVPVALDMAHRSGAFAAGDIVMLAGFGGGMSIGACLLRWSGPVSEVPRLRPVRSIWTSDS